MQVEVKQQHHSSSKAAAPQQDSSRSGLSWEQDRSSSKGAWQQHGKGISRSKAVESWTAGQYCGVPGAAGVALFGGS